MIGEEDNMFIQFLIIFLFELQRCDSFSVWDEFSCLTLSCSLQGREIFERSRRRGVWAIFIHYIFLSLYLSISLPLSISLSIYLSLYLSICLSLYLSISISIFLYLYFFCLSISLWLSISLSLYLSVSLSLCLLSLCISIFRYPDIYLSIYLTICMYTEMNSERSLMIFFTYSLLSLLFDREQLNQRVRSARSLLMMCWCACAAACPHYSFPSGSSRFLRLASMT